MSSCAIPASKHRAMQNKHEKKEKNHSKKLYKNKNSSSAQPSPSVPASSQQESALAGRSQPLGTVKPGGRKGESRRIQRREFPQTNKRKVIVRSSMPLSFAKTPQNNQRKVIVKPSILLFFANPPKQEKKSNRKVIRRPYPHPSRKPQPKTPW